MIKIELVPKEEADRRIAELQAENKRLQAENERLENDLKICANWAHHGGLLDGGGDGWNKSLVEVRRLTLPYWDKEECNRLQAELEGGGDE